MDLNHHFMILSVFLSIIITQSLSQLSRQTEYQFVFGIPDSGWDDVNHTPHVFITTSLTLPIETTLSIPGIGFKSVNVVTKSTAVDVPLPENILMMAGDGKQNKTIIVTASNTVSVYGFDSPRGNGDGFIAVPSAQLGTQYYAVSASYRYQNTHTSFICISSLNDDTSVFIKTKSGQEHNLNLNKYESYRFDSVTDVSATFIGSSKPVAVISGGNPAGSTKIESMFEQLPPVHNWGKHFLLTPFLSIQTGYLYRVFAAENSTRLNINSNSVTLDAGEYYEGGISGDIVILLSSNLPVMVIEIMRDRDSNLGRGDYAALLISPVKHYTNNVTFPVFRYINTYYTINYYINVVIDCYMVNGLLYDDIYIESMTGWDHLTSEDGSMCVVRRTVTTGSHSVSHSDVSARFTVSVYGICNCALAYAFPAGITYRTDTSRDISTESGLTTSPTTMTTQTSRYEEEMIRLIQVGTSDIYLQWEDFMLEGDISSFRVFYSVGDTFDSTNAEAIFLDGDENGVTITGLDSATTYTIRVEAVTDDDRYRLGEIRVTTQPDIIKVLDTKATELEIEWNSYQPDEPLNHYRVIYSSGAFLDIDTAESLIVNRLDKRVVITGLAPNTEYTVTVEAVTEEQIIIEVGEIQVMTDSATISNMTNSRNVALIGGAAGGGALVIIIIIIVIVLVCRRNGSSRNQDKRSTKQSQLGVTPKPGVAGSLNSGYEDHNSFDPNGHMDEAGYMEIVSHEYQTTIT
ncbi:uncharacterized protein [Amphiura filiformis]|uniref:uncharacterized protein n=1 Tax=Amphiura filiformis TaxID=82378 RepID=UPI003B20E02B